MSIFRFKHFSVIQENSQMKVGTDSMLLGACINAVAPNRILDIGAGTGVLSLMMAQKCPKATIDAVEVDLNALKDCRSNFSASDWSNRLNVIAADFLQFSSNARYDLIISNPPFFENSLKNDLESKTLARHTDSLPIESLVQKVSTLISDQGYFWVILPLNTASRMIDCAQNYTLYPSTIWEIEGKPGNPIRKIIEFSKCKTHTVTEKKLCVRDVEGNYTKEYKQLTIDYHNKAL
jgi:tRNA1Val (adenine37-N6)-methyltransferase